MIKVIYCIRRKAELSPEAFQDYWKNAHGQLLMEHRHTLRLAGYVQTSPAVNAYSARVERKHVLDTPYDGVAELYWASEQDMEYAFESSEARRVQRMLADDELNFIDHSRSARWIARETAPIPWQEVEITLEKP
jgi:uncharacterized protein (TIGR02118 family)